MPSSMTHTYFGMDVYNKLNRHSRNILKNNLEYYKLFCQGSDPFMFYHFLVGKKALEYGMVQRVMHTSKTREFFVRMARYIYDNKLLNNGEAMSYLYGYICHYYLDLYTHPLIYYKSGIFKRHDKSTYKYNGVHAKMEYQIDLWFIERREKIDAKKFKVYKNIFGVKNLTPTLRGIIDETIGSVYSIDKASYIYEKCIWYMRNFFRIFNYDPYGIKLKIYSLVDGVTPKHFIKFKVLSFGNKYKNNKEVLNLDNRSWHLPWDKDSKFKSSFLDLYNIALDKSVKTISEVTRLLSRDRFDEKKFEELFLNLSFVTGIDCDKRVGFKYFEF